MEIHKDEPTHVVCVTLKMNVSLDSRERPSGAQLSSVRRGLAEVVSSYTPGYMAIQMSVAKVDTDVNDMDINHCINVGLEHFLSFSLLGRGSQMLSAHDSCVKRFS